MAEGTNTAQADTAGQAGIDPGAEPATGEAGDAVSRPAGGSRTFTQEEVNDMLASERKSERAKYSAFKKKADEYDALAAERDAIAAERDRLRSEAERRSLVEKVARETDVPASTVEMLSGQTEQELTEQARRIAQASGGAVASEGGRPAGVKASSKESFVNDLFG